MRYVVEPSEEGRVPCVRWDHRVVRRSSGWRWEGRHCEGLVRCGDPVVMRPLSGAVAAFFHRPPAAHPADHYPRLLSIIRDEARELGEPMDIVEHVCLALQFAENGHHDERDATLAALRECPEPLPIRAATAMECLISEPTGPAAELRALDRELRKLEL